MKLDVGRLSIEVPDAFEDVTSYVFVEHLRDEDAGASPDRLSVSFEPMPEHVPPAELIAIARRSMERSAGGAASFTGGSAAAGRLPAATLRVDVPGSPVAMFLAVFRWPGGLAGKVQYESRRPDAAAVFDRVVASIRPIGVRAAPPPGFVRRRAGRLWLEIPVAHAPLSSYVFAANGGRARLFVDDEGGPPGEEPDFESWVDHGVFESIEVEPLNEGACAADRRPVEERSWRADRIGEEGDHLGSTWFRVAWISFAEGPAAHVWMMEDETPEIGDACWPDVVAGIRLLAEGP